MPNRKLSSKFNAAISQVEDLLAVNAYLEAEVPAIAVSDHLLRASLTMIVSAIDALIHELVINAIVYELKESKSVFTTKGIQVDVSAIRDSDSQNRLKMIEASLRRQYSKQSFQSSRQVEGALSSVGMYKIWKKLSVRLNQPAEDIVLPYIGHTQATQGQSVSYT